jgi:integrase
VETARAWLARLMLKGGGGRGERRRGKLLSSRTISNVVVLVRVALERAVQEGVLSSNPLRAVRVPRSAGASTEQGWTVLEADEQRALLDACSVEGALYSMVAIALGTGVRRGELLALEWPDVVLDGPEPHLVIRYGKPGKPTKGGRPRRVPLFGLGLEAITSWKSTPRGVDPPSVAVFPDHRVKVPAPAFRRALVRAGIARNVRWHDLRHTCATSLLEGWWGRAWTLEEVRQLLGHRSTATTERYLHARGSLVFRAAKEARKGGTFFRDALKTDNGSSVR